MASSALLLPSGPQFAIKSRSSILAVPAIRLPNSIVCSSTTDAGSKSIRKGFDANVNLTSRRSAIGMLMAISAYELGVANSNGAGLPPEEKPKLCDNTCEKELENIPTITTESGLQYKDIKVGEGPTPPIGFQVAANYVAMVPSGQIFDSSLEKGQPYLFRVGSGQVIKGLDEGILSMKVGGQRRLYIPGPLAFPKGLSSAPGRPRVAPNSPVVFDVLSMYLVSTMSDCTTDFHGWIQIQTHSRV